MRFWIFYFMSRKTAIRNLFSNKAVENAHKNNTIDKESIVVGIYFATYLFTTRAVASLTVPGGGGRGARVPPVSFFPQFRINF